MGNHLISVIIPVYNVEKYVRKCVESVTGQTYKNLEIILVDDGSTDNGGVICDELAKNDGRIRVFHTENAGVSSARNLGLRESKGEYIAFVDSDDYVTADYILHLYELLKEHNADISITNYCTQYDGKDRPEKKFFSPCTLVMDKREALEELLYENIIYAFSWCRLFHRSLFDGVSFPVGKFYEDFGTIYKLFDKAERIVYNSTPDYIYLQRLGSTTHSLKKQFIDDYITQSEEMMQFIKDKYPELIDAAIVRCFHPNLMCLKKIRFSEIYWGNYTYIRANIIKYRKSVLWNHKSSARQKISAILSYTGIWVLKMVFSFFENRRVKNYVQR